MYKSGNGLLRNLIRNTKSTYDAIPKKGRPEFYKNIMKHILSNGGRFLEKHHEGRYYVVVEDKTKIYDKIRLAYFNFKE